SQCIFRGPSTGRCTLAKGPEIRPCLFHPWQKLCDREEFCGCRDRAEEGNRARSKHGGRLQPSCRYLRRGEQASRGIKGTGSGSGEESAVLSGTSNLRDNL